MIKKTKIKLILISFIIAILLLVASRTYADRLYGIDYILGMKYASAIKEAHPKGLACGFLWSARGIKEDSYRVIDMLLSTGKCPVIRVHGVWRDNHTFNQSESNEAIAVAGKLRPLIKKYPNITWYYSPFLEPTYYSKDLYIKTLSQSKKILPKGVILVSSALDGYKFKKVITELHHRSWKQVKGKTIFSFDGMSAVDSDVTKWKRTTRGTEIFFVWDWGLNGKYSVKDKTARPQRKSYADYNYIKSLAYLTDKKYKTSLPDKWLYKTHAEQYYPPIPRGYKPVWIIPIKAKHIKLGTKKKIFYKFEYEKPYPHGDGFIYRAKDYGYEIADLVRKQKKYKKKPTVNVFVNNKKYGTINPSFRDGYYLH